MCPLTCSTVKEAIKAHEERGVIIGEYIDYFKQHNVKCQMCIRNEHSTLPKHLVIYDGEKLLV